LKELSPVARVCQLWNRIVNHGYVWCDRPSAFITKEEGKLQAKLMKAKYCECSSISMKGLKELLKLCIKQGKKSQTASRSTGRSLF